MFAAELDFVRALHNATMQKLVAWSIADNADREIFVALVADQEVTVELLSLPDKYGAERLMYRVNGLKVQFCFSVGTEGYGLISDMLSETIHGWSTGRAAAQKSLAKATELVRSLRPLG
jgi:hypothetical protein